MRSDTAKTCQGALEDLLFSSSDHTLVNLKLLRGDAPAVSKEELCAELHSGIIQKNLGMADTHERFPESGDPEKIDLAQIA